MLVYIYASVWFFRVTCPLNLDRKVKNSVLAKLFKHAGELFTIQSIPIPAHTGALVILRYVIKLNTYNELI